jgi:hypothetical protein
VIVELDDGRHIEVPDGTREFDFEGITYEVPNIDLDAHIDNRITDLEARLNGSEDTDAAIINRALEELELQTGRALDPAEAQALGELAAEARDPDGRPDVTIMADALAMKDAIDDFQVPPEDHAAFMEAAFDAQAYDGTPDFLSAYSALYDDDEPEPELAPLEPTASRQETSDYIAARAARIEADQRQDRAERVQARRDGLDLGTPDADLHDYERWGVDADPSAMSRSELAEFMAERVTAMNAADVGA